MREIRAWCERRFRDVGSAPPLVEWCVCVCVRSRAKSKEQRVKSKRTAKGVTWQRDVTVGLYSLVFGLWSLVFARGTHTHAGKTGGVGNASAGKGVNKSCHTPGREIRLEVCMRVPRGHRALSLSHSLGTRPLPAWAATHLLGAGRLRPEE